MEVHLPFLTNGPNCSPKPYTSSPGEMLSSEWTYRTNSGDEPWCGFELRSVVRHELFDALRSVHLYGTS